MDKKIKTIHDVFKLGSRAVINNQDYQLEEIMIWGTAEIIYTILRFIAKNGKNIVCSVDIETNEIMLLSSEQSTLYHENLNMHKERLVKTDSAGILNYKANSHRTENKVAIEKIIKQRNVKWVTSIVSLNDEDYKITWFSFLCNKEGDSLLVCVSEEEMQRGLSTQSLYCDDEQTLRNYVHHLEESGQIDPSDQHRRIYDHVFDTPPGEQMLIDFGEVTLSRRGSIHFICLLLRYSRILCVYAQDHKYNATKACQAIYRSFCKLGGRPAVLVIDQDAVFVASETYGEVIKTRIFGDFCTEQDLKLWVCNKADPESKGPIENSVGFVKKNFFSARTITCIDDVWRSLPGWLERKNKRIHRATLRIPMAVFRDIEKDSLRSVLPSVYETSPNSFIAYECKGTPYVLFRSCRYSVPRSYAYSVVKYKITAGKIHIYDEDLRFLCTHLLSERRGSFNQLPEHRKGDSGDWIEIMERLCDKWNCYDFQHFINGVKKENPRHISKQLGAIEQFLDSENPDRALVADVMKRCCDNYRYQFSQFKVVYEYVKAGRSLADSDGARVVVSSDRVEYKDLSVYGKAFQERVNRSGQEAAV